MKTSNARVAVVQAGSALFDTPRTLERMQALCERAQGERLGLVVFPEAYVGGYPKGLDFGARLGTRSPAGRDDFLLQLVDDSYALRVAGFVLGTGLLMVVPMVGTVWFAIADRSPREQRRHGLGEMSARFARRMGRHVAAYLAPSFHPANVRD